MGDFSADSFEWHLYYCGWTLKGEWHSFFFFSWLPYSLGVRGPDRKLYVEVVHNPLRRQSGSGATAGIIKISDPIRREDLCPPVAVQRWFQVRKGKSRPSEPQTQKRPFIPICEASFSSPAAPWVGAIAENSMMPFFAPLLFKRCQKEKAAWLIMRAKKGETNGKE